MSRDLFKSEYSYVEIPEIDLSLQQGTLGGIYTTVEGLLNKIHEKLENANPFRAGDSSMDKKFVAFLNKIEELKTGEMPFTLIIDDPLSNNYIYSPLAPDPDPQIEIEDYERTFEQNEDLGINDMKVD
jgi:zinc finger protein